MRTDHLPFPMPKRRHALVQSWLDLTFLHWPVAPERLAPYIPNGLELDTHEGVAYLGVIPFIMTGVRPDGRHMCPASRPSPSSTSAPT